MNDLHSAAAAVAVAQDEAAEEAALGALHRRLSHSRATFTVTVFPPSGPEANLAFLADLPEDARYAIRIWENGEEWESEQFTPHNPQNLRLLFRE